MAATSSPQPNSPQPNSARPKTFLPRLGAGVGGALLAFAIAMPSYGLPQLKVIPLSAGGHTITEAAPAMLLDAQAFAKGEVLPEHVADPVCQDQPGVSRQPAKPVYCFIGHHTEVKSTRFIEAVEPSNKKVITLRAGNILQRLDRPEPQNLVNATVDTITLNRRSALPVEEKVSTFHAVTPALGLDDTTGAFVREGVQYQFPFDTAERSYQYFDTTAQVPKLIDFIGEETQTAGDYTQEVYHFNQRVGAVNMFDAISLALGRDGEISEKDKATLAGLRMKSVAGRWYSPEELKERGLEADSPVVMTRYYANVRDLRVQPDTGVIVNGEEHLHYFFAQTQEEADAAAQAGFNGEPPSPYRTALALDAKWNEATRIKQMTTAANALQKLALVRYVCFGAGVLGLILLAVSLGVALRRR